MLDVLTLREAAAFLRLSERSLYEGLLTVGDSDPGAAVIQALRRWSGGLSGSGSVRGQRRGLGAGGVAAAGQGVGQWRDSEGQPAVPGSGAVAGGGPPAPARPAPPPLPPGTRVPPRSPPGAGGGGRTASSEPLPRARPSVTPRLPG